MARYKNFGVKTFQAEDEIAAMCAVIGASFGGAFAATGTSGPGMALKGEAMGLAVMLELPCLIVNVQRGGPSTGLPTKTEQSDLFQGFYGRHGDCPLPILAACSPSDCFWMSIEAFRIAVKYMTPVLLLSDGYLGNGAEPMQVPKVEDLPVIEVKHPDDPTAFQPYARDANLARPWAIPGTPGLAHRIGGLEKEHLTGDVSYDPLNHQRMSELRAEKIRRVADSIPDQTVFGDSEGDLLVVSWGGVFGAARTAVERTRRRGFSVSHAQIRYLNPFPKNLSDVLSRFKKILVPELNLGQLSAILRSKYLIDPAEQWKVQGRPFSASEIANKIEQIIAEE
ncbi:MAG: 2-oxoglutarate oxidoreductase subunit KorA [candidate division BRC1 bacterium ADurb.BinA364]|nr:MAG: 2-oxoglutarate oxidoreductase subunit KorA [candidate division BRC1 bacterium ADurb.BinA364]